MHPTTILFTCGIAAGVLVPALILTDGATRPGYSLWRHGASQLGTGQRGWLQTVNFVIGGLLLFAFAAGLRRVLCRAAQPGHAAVWGPILLAAAGLALAVAGIVPTDPALGYPPGKPEVITAAGRVHGLASLVLFAALAATPFTLAKPLRGSNRGWVTYSRWSGALVIAFAIAAGITLTQVLFHRFTRPLPLDREPPPPITPIKTMSYAIQAEPRLAWRDILLQGALLLWALGMLITQP